MSDLNGSSNNVHRSIQENPPNRDSNRQSVVYDPSYDIIPIETNDIVRLKIFIPLATLTALFSNLVCALLVEPSMGEVNDLYYTLLTPRKFLIGIYWLLIFACQLGMSFMIVFTSNQRYRTEETKQTFVNGLGISYVCALFGFAFWPIFWSQEMFILSTIILAVIFLLLTYVMHSLWKHSPPTFIHRPFSFVLIYTPVQLFHQVLLTVDLPQSLLLSLKWYRSPLYDNWESHQQLHSWIIVGIVVVVGLINSFIIYRTREILRTVAFVYLLIAILTKGDNDSKLGKLKDSPQVAGALIAMGAIGVFSFVFGFFELDGRSGGRRGRILLEDGGIFEEEEDSSRSRAMGQEQARQSSA
ncbi:hypothetical protein BY996DRAFT_6430640 [Phakopsora pachyrhizi]|uniref:Uncharacterized protein n=1 Tax=Phakopsora pachyrhizi TaxID=170000 RepID=A0AAV0AXR7_PHAPC|nr:hypothetical protein BY996DRAFT_6430640 [Phakopsora pachyrhizi]CAH7675174.1 hypothetical protein PPACK8108_LOCUS10145 [Phakopsora pachyrhizi]